MHGFIASPALAKLVALQMVDEQLQGKPRRPSRRTRTPFRARAGPSMESLTCGYGRGSKLLLVNPLRGEGALVRPATSG